MVANNCEKMFHSSGFQQTSVDTTYPDGSVGQTTMYMRDPIDVLKQQISALEDRDAFTFRPVPKSRRSDGSTYQSTPMETSHFHDVYSSVRRRVFSTTDISVVWNDNIPSTPRSFVGFLQFFSDKTATTLTSSAFVAYPLHAVFLNTSPEHREWLINNGYTIIGFLPVSTSDSNTEQNDMDSTAKDSLDGDSNVEPLDDEVRLTSTSNGREQNMLVLHNALKTALKSLEDVAPTGFLVSSRSSGTWRCFPALVSYCADIPEAKNLTTVKHGLAVTRPCHRCLGTLSDFEKCSNPVNRHRSHTAEVRRIVSELAKKVQSLEGTRQVHQVRLLKKSIEETLKSHSLASWESFLENLLLVDKCISSDLYSILTYEPLHNLFLGLSRLLKFCLILYLSSKLLSTKQSGRGKKPRVFNSIKTAVLRGCNTVLAEFQKYYVPPGLRVDFSKHEGSSQLNGIFVQDGLRGMLEGKDYRTLDCFFPFIFAYVDSWLGYSEEAPLTKIHVLYTDLVNRLMSDNYSNGWSDAELQDLRSTVLTFKKQVWSLFGPHCDRGLNTLKFHLLDHLVDDLQRFGTVRVLSASPYEHYNVVIKQSYSGTSKRLQTRERDTIRNLDTDLKRKRLASIQLPARNVGKRQNHGLVNTGERISFQVLLQLERKEIDCDLSQNPFLPLLQNSFTSDAFPQLLQLVKEELTGMDPPLLPSMVDLLVVQSGYIHGGFVPHLSDCREAPWGGTVLGHDDKRIGKETCVRQRVFGIGWARPYLPKKQSFVVLKGEEEGETVLWVAKVLLLFKLSATGYGDIQEFAYVQYMEVTDAVSGVDRALDCVCLRWATADEVDRTLNIEQSLQGTQVQEGEYYGLVPFNSIISTVSVVRSNIAISPFTEKLPWPLHRFYINRFLPSRDPLLTTEMDFIDSEKQREE